jgi:hypothetical protein
MAESGDTFNFFVVMLKTSEPEIRNQCRRFPAQGVLLLHENACPHSAAIRQLKFELLLQPPHSPDLAYLDNLMFEPLKIKLCVDEDLPVTMKVRMRCVRYFEYYR